MFSSDDISSIMRPSKGDTKINIPITFGYNGGRKEYNKTKIIWVCILSVVGLIVGIGTITSKEGSFLFNLLFGSLIILGVSLIIRFPIMKEHIIRNNMLKIKDEDYKVGSEDIWGIYSIDDTYPYYVHFRDGSTGIFIRFEKDVILGKQNENEYEHYEAIGDAYNLAGAFKIGMCHIDYMDFIGNDDRIDDRFNSLSQVENPDMVELLTDIYTNLQETMNKMVTTFDVYVFTFKYSESTFWYHINQVIACMMEANYASFTILNSYELRNLTKSLFNIHDFSTMDACYETFGSDRKAGVIPISLFKYDGSEVKLNKTLEEKRLEEENSNNNNKVSNKKRFKRDKISSDSKVIGSDDEINLF